MNHLCRSNICASAIAAVYLMYKYRRVKWAAYSGDETHKPLAVRAQVNTVLTQTASCLVLGFVLGFVWL